VLGTDVAVGTAVGDADVGAAVSGGVGSLLPVGGADRGAGGAVGVRVPRWRDGLAVIGHAEGVATLGRLLALFGDADGDCGGTAGTGPLGRGVRQSSQSPAAQYCGMSQLPSHR
jgi:hypothetical protein